MNKADLLAEILAMTAPAPPVEGDELTVIEVAEAAGWNRGMAQRKLDDLVAAGVMTRRQATRAGRPCWAYRKVASNG